MDLLHEDLLQEDFEICTELLNSEKSKRATPSAVAAQSTTVSQSLATPPNYLTSENLENTKMIHQKETLTSPPSKHNGYQLGGVRPPITTTNITILKPLIHIPGIPSPHSPNKA